ncbi:MAG: hypothetical protein K0B15_13710 [Lentimicrobium sp.]|nr:hypothetical protein [Lentimicrobium sp.]
MFVKSIKILTVVTAMSFLTSCSPRMVGNWTVQRYETITPDQQGVVLSNIGTMQFYNDGSGEKNLNYSIFGVTYDDQIPFEWKGGDGKYITIVSEGSELSKTWIVMENKKKSQKWKSTDGSDKIQILELKK